MEGFELNIMINRPAEEVFGFLANLENDLVVCPVSNIVQVVFSRKSETTMLNYFANAPLEWRREWVEARNMSGGSLGVGATFRLTGELLGRQIPTVYEVIEYEPNRSVENRVRTPPADIPEDI